MISSLLALRALKGGLKNGRFYELKRPTQFQPDSTIVLPRQVTIFLRRVK